MIALQEFYLVLTDVVLNRKMARYRGIYRTDPLSLAFHQERADAIDALVTNAGDSEDGRFAHRHAAFEWRTLAHRNGFECEVVKVVPSPVAAVSIGDANTETFLGWDVGQPDGGFYSAIVDRCMAAWEGTDDDDPSSFVTLSCLGRYFASRLNKYGLFDGWEESKQFLRADRECAERFGGEMNITMCPIGVAHCTSSHRD